MSTVTPQPAQPAHAWREQVLAGFRRELDSMIEQHEITEFTEQTATEAVSASSERLREIARNRDRFGTFFTSQKVGEKLGGISRQAVSARVQKSTLLRVTTSDDVSAFPSFQIRAGDVPGPMKKLFQTLLPAAPDPWGVLYWMTSPLEEFGGRTAVEVVDDGDWREVKLLKGMAQDDASGWAAG
ncbi:MAG: hypothetical protein ACTHV2_09035 [Brachybacterium sp.]|uniref:hypothetical protein n=1 Tax=Brachybacterium sp. TaxID=1891286 RepID=UPI00264D3D0C|nr:hypothetical protein [Brachybacterium sp.]MDN6303107.1 hypothetical protein [Brachybacterium sp.]MDN6330526.1 hypothetical protein [Brachybacterium sp.]